MARPVVSLALAYGVGLLLGRWVSLPLLLLFTVWGLVLIVALCWTRARPWLALAGFLFAGWTNLTLRTSVIYPGDLRRFPGELPTLASVRGVLAETPSPRMSIRHGEEVWRSVVTMDVTAIREQGAAVWRDASGRVLITTSEVLDQRFYKGRIVEVTGVIQPPPVAPVEGLFDYRGYLRNHGIHHQLRARSGDDWVLLPPESSRPWADQFLGWAQAALARGMPTEDTPIHLLWAMTLGWKTTLTPEVYQPFMTSGTLHIFAISGLHIALIALILVQALKLLRLSRRNSSALVIALLWFYTAATGWQPSAIRATVMMTIVIGGWVLQRPSDLLNSLSTAGLVILVWDPLQLFGASFQLSFFVVLSLALLTPPLMDLRERLLRFDPLLPPDLAPWWQRHLLSAARSLWALAATSLAAWLGSLPITAFYFHLFSPVTVLANLILVPLSTAALAANLASLTFAWLPPVAELFNHSAWWFMLMMMRASEWASMVPGAYCHVRAPGLIDIVAYYAVLLLILSPVLWCPEKRRKTLLALIATGCAWLACTLTMRTPERLTLLAEGGGAALLAEASAQHPHSLIDATHSNSAPRLLTHYLHARGMDSLPALTLSHGDVQHVGGAQHLIDTFSIPRLEVGPLPFRSPAYRRTLAEFPTNRLIRLKAGDRCGPWRVLHPVGDERFTSADDLCLVFSGEFAGVRVVYLTDLGPPGQEVLLRRQQLSPADIVITGLPSTGEPLRPDLLEALRPQLVIVVDAAFPAMQRTPDQLRKRLASRPVRIIYTREHGSLVLEFDREHFEVRGTDGLRVRGRAGGGSGKRANLAGSSDLSQEQAGE